MKYTESLKDFFKPTVYIFYFFDSMELINQDRKNKYE